MAKKKKVLITGAAGFIGFHLISRLLRDGLSVVGIDNLNDYYDQSLKHARLVKLGELTSELDADFSFVKLDLQNRKSLEELFNTNNFDIVINLAAQAGVRYSLDNPHVYAESNLVGFLNLLECCRYNKPEHFLFASSSSVYGLNQKIPFSRCDNTDHPISLYAATKKSNELMAHAYAHLYNFPITGLRFFTVYGPFGRPDMAYFKFTKAILAGEPIDIYNHGIMERDFTYIDDVTEAISRLIPMTPNVYLPKSSTVKAPFNIHNIGNNNPVELRRFIAAIEKSIGIEAIKNNLPMQPGDVQKTYADVDALTKLIGFKPDTSIEDGIEKFVVWYRDYVTQTSDQNNLMKDTI
jgi:UDP-glucuronate 4-epimerase